MNKVGEGLQFYSSCFMGLYIAKVIVIIFIPAIINDNISFTVVIWSLNDFFIAAILNAWNG